MGQSPLDVKIMQYVREKLSGMQERVSVADRCDIAISAAPRVFCAKCRKHIYYLKETDSTQYSFAPMEPGRPVRTDMKCPECGEWIFAKLNGQAVIRTDRGWV